jgi:hypothetical protein
LEPEPAGGEHAQEMPTRKKENIALNRAQPTHHAVGPGPDLIRRFSSRAAVAEQLPIGAILENLDRTATLILAVVPFQQIVIDRGLGSETSQLAGPGGALQGTGEDLRQPQSLQPLPETAGVALTTFGKRQVGQSRMLA